MAKNGKIAVIGSSNTDLVVNTPHFPAPGETILGRQFLMNPGGKGANQAVAAARLGGRVAFIGKTGNDYFGRETRKNLAKEGIELAGLTTDSDTPSGIAQITVNEQGENTIVVAPGANMNLQPDDLDRASDIIEEASILLIQLEIPLKTVFHAAKKGFKSGKIVILNPAPAAELPAELFPNLTLITPNVHEAGQLSGETVNDRLSALKSAKILRKKGGKNILITMGEKGALLYTSRSAQIIPAPEVQPVDTTAAGDCLNGALSAALARGENLSDAVRFAVKAASLSVMRPGAQNSLPYLSEVDISKTNQT
ncbi:MAG: ribokinase [Balneolaceae bacterium]|nr:ribokinase [Balneolaceae bacterium]